MSNEDTLPPPVSQDAASEPAQLVSEQPAPESPTGPMQTLPETQTAQIPASEPFDSAPSSAEASAGRRDLLVKARATIQERKAKKLEKILEALNAKGKNGSTGSPQVTNDEVEKLLHVSDATATRYLSALEKEGKIQQVGKTGKAVEYRRGSRYN